MERASKIYPSASPSFIEKALVWADQFDHFSYFNPNQILYPHGPFRLFLAVGDLHKFKFEFPFCFEGLKNTLKDTPDWLIGYLGYDLKNEVENLTSLNNDRMGFEPMVFFQPQHLLFFEQDRLNILSTNDPDWVIAEIDKVVTPSIANYSVGSLHCNMSSEQYLEKVKTIKHQIVEGDIYELNLCMEYYSDEAKLSPLSCYWKLNQTSPMPFSVLQKIQDKYLLCASPERFIKKQRGQLLSQPIKGTIRRGSNDQEDQMLKHQLRYDEKELAENMMIVDLVRNDLARSAEPGSVKVEEMFGIYSFKYLHHMISTITSQLRTEVDPVDAIKFAFPMGSMTGAPKIKAMELIDHYEHSKRGIFSGAAGYFTPEGDFDFNVIIRSLMYDPINSILSFQVGSAITSDSIAEKEYQECLLKAQAITQVLNQWTKTTKKTQMVE